MMKIKGIIALRATASDTIVIPPGADLLLLLLLLLLLFKGLWLLLANKYCKVYDWGNYWFYLLIIFVL